MRNPVLSRTDIIVFLFQSDEVGRICFAFCHLIGMSSAFSNPILYGWFNEAFQDEFTSIGRYVILFLKVSIKYYCTLYTPMC